MQVLVVSNNQVLSAELNNLLTSNHLVTQVAFYSGDIDDAQFSVNAEHDILLLDCSLKGLEKLDLLEKLMVQKVSLNVVLLVDDDSSELLLRALRLGVKEVVKLPVSHVDFNDALQHIYQKLYKPASKSQGEVISLMSCKGGGGASFLAANLGYVLAKAHGCRVLLIDLNLQFGDVLLYLSNRQAVKSVFDVASDIERLDMMLLRSSAIEILPAYFVLASSEDPTGAQDMRAAHVERLVRLAQENFDYVILDVGRSLDVCTLKALDLSNKVLPVLQLSLPFLKDARRLINVLRSLDYSDGKIRPIVNRVERFEGDISLKNAQELINAKIYSTIRNHYKVATASVNQGVPVFELDSNSHVSKDILKLANLIAKKKIKKSKQKSIFSRLLS